MADTGAPFSLPFPQPPDFVRVAPSDFQALAERVETFLLLTAPAANKTANYTLQLADTGRVVEFNATGPVTLTVPTEASVAFPIGAVVFVYNLTSQPVTIQGAAGVTVRNAGAIGEFQEVSLRKRLVNQWVLTGL